MCVYWRCKRHSQASSLRFTKRGRVGGMMSVLSIKNKGVLILVFVFFSQKLKCQNIDNYSYHFGKEVASVQPFNKIYPISNFQYKFYKQPYSLNSRFVKSFYKNCLTNPIDVMLSNICSKNLDWYNNTVKDKVSSENFNKEVFLFRMGKDFDKKFIFEIIAESNFEYKGKKYVIYIYKTNAFDSELEIYDQVLEQQNSGDWLLYNEDQLSRFSAYMYLNPEELERLLDQSSRSYFTSQEFVKEYVFDNNFRIDKRLYTKMVYQKIYSSISIFNYVYKRGQHDILIDQPVLNLEDSYSKKVGAIYTYDKVHLSMMSNFSVKNDWLDSKKDFVFNKTPEEAFCSFLFLKDLNDVQSNSIEFSDLTNIFNRYSSLKKEHIRIEWDYKLVFSDSIFDYALLYYSEFLCNRDLKSVCNEEWLGEKSVLLKHDGKKWLISSVPKSISRFVESMNLLNKKAIIDVFKNPSIFKNGNLQEQFLVKGILTYPTDNRVIINQLDSNFFSLEYQTKFPTSIKRYWKTMGFYDIYGDRGLTDWVYRY